MNRTQLRDEVADHGYADISSSEIEDAVNIAYLEVCGAAAWPFLEAGPATLTISPSSRYAQLKAGLSASGYAEGSRVLGVTRGGVELGALSPDDYFGGPHALPLGATQPTHYTIFAGSLYITPAPSAGTTVDVRFLKQPSALGASDEPVFPSRYHQLIVYAAVALLAGEDDDSDVQARFRALFDKGIEQMKTDLMIKSEGRTTPYGVEGSLTYWADRARSSGFPKTTNSEVAILLRDTIADVCSRYAWPFLRVDTDLTTVAQQDYVLLPSNFGKTLGIYIPSLGTQVNYSSLADTRFDSPPELHSVSASVWSSSQTYTTSELVLYNGLYYSAVSSSTNVVPGTDQTKWIVVNPIGGTGTPKRYSIAWANGTTTFPNRQARLVLWPVPDRSYSLKVEYERCIIVNTADPNAPIEWPASGSVLELGILYRLAMRSGDKDSAMRLTVFKNEYEEAIVRMRNELLIEQRDRDPVVRITQTDLWDL